MKKTIALFTTALMLFAMIFPVSAEVGDIAGQIYSTDIASDIDDMPIQSYNIGGRTVIIAEDLINYGFKVIWNAEGRRLDIYTGKLPESSPEPEISFGETIGSVIGNIYETDIVTAFNDMFVETYNLGGKTAVVLEDMASLSASKQISRDNNLFYNLGMSIAGAKALWNESARTISLYCLRPGDYMSIDGKDYLIKGDYIELKDYYTTAVNLTNENGEHLEEWVSANIHGDKLYIPLEISQKYAGQKLSYEYATTRGATYNNLLYLECGNYDAYYYKGYIMVDASKDLFLTYKE